MLGKIWRALKTILGIVDTAGDIVDAGSEIARAVRPAKQPHTPRPPPIPEGPSPRQPITPIPPTSPSGARPVPRPVPIKRR